MWLVQNLSSVIVDLVDMELNCLVKTWMHRISICQIVTIRPMKLITWSPCMQFHGISIIIQGWLAGFGNLLWYSVQTIQVKSCMCLLYRGRCEANTLLNEQVVLLSSCRNVLDVRIFSICGCIFSWITTRLPLTRQSLIMANEEEFFLVLVPLFPCHPFRI